MLFRRNVSFTFPKIILKNTTMYVLYNNLSFYITFTMFHYIGQGSFWKSVILQKRFLETGGVFSCENTPKGHTGPHKSSFFHINK